MATFIKCLKCGKLVRTAYAESSPYNNGDEEWCECDTGFTIAYNKHER